MALTKVHSRMFANDPINAADFGVVGDGVTDDTSALQAFFDAISATDYGAAEMNGTYAVSSALTLGPSTGTIATTLLYTNATFVATSSIGTILTLRNCDEFTHVGSIFIDGGGTIADYSTWLVTKGIEVQSASKHVSLDNIQIDKVKHIGLDILDDGVGSDILSFFDCRKFDSSDIGMRVDGTGAPTATISAVSNTGSSGTNAQRTVLTLSAVPSELEVEDQLVVDGYPYHIYGISGSDVDIFPWVPSTITGGETVKFMRGGSVRVTGNDANLSKFGQIRATRCNYGLLADQSYNITADRVYAQYCSTSLVIGKDPSVVVNGVFFTAVGGEASVTFPPILRTRAMNTGFIQGYPLGSDVLGTHRARLTGDAFAKTTLEAQGLEFLLTKDGGVRSPQWNFPRNYMAATAANNEIENGQKSRVYLTAADPDVSIKFNVQSNELFGYTGIEIVWASTTASGANNLTIELNTDDITDGWVIDAIGGAFTGTSYVVALANMPAVVSIVPEIESKKWVVVVK